MQAVLVNGNTASTAEFLAAAIQDSQAGQLVGEHTFGKGRMQRVIPLSSGAALLLSNSGFMTPAHHRIDHVGDPAMLAALSRLCCADEARP